MRAVDTNLLVRLLTRDDQKQADRAERFIAEGAWASHLVLAETIWVLETVFGLDDERLALAVEMLLEHSTLALQDPEVVEAALISFRSPAECGFSDCLILEIARKAGHLPLGTFDRALSRIDGAERA